MRVRDHRCWASVGRCRLALSPPLPRKFPSVSPTDKPFKAVIELFTSQGCSSCPPADALLKTLSDDPSIIALSLPVDYWNYLGWKDTFASPRNTERQRNYARNARRRRDFHAPGYRQRHGPVNGVIQGSASTGHRGDLENGRTASRARPLLAGAQYTELRTWRRRSPGHAPREATVWLGVVQMAGAVQIKQGENAGKTLTYTNIVRELTPIGIWKGMAMKVQLPRAAMMQADVQKVVVLVQEGRSGPIIGATMAGLW